jgi:hypothetical protein
MADLGFDHDLDRVVDPRAGTGSSAPPGIQAIHPPGDRELIGRGRARAHRRLLAVCRHIAEFGRV